MTWRLLLGVGRNVKHRLWKENGGVWLDTWKRGSTGESNHRWIWLRRGGFSKISQCTTPL